jgi:hypothetical protein
MELPMRTFCYLFAITALTSFAVAAVGQADDQLPHFVIIYADDLG